jgi:site-specific recombinase XerD
VREFVPFTALQDYMGLRSAARSHIITPALGDAQARKLLEAPPADTLKGVRDRAILATLLYHGIRREELCGLRVKDLHSRQGVMHIRVKGKRSKIRFIPVNPAAQRMIEDYLALTGRPHRQRTFGAIKMVAALAFQGLCARVSARGRLALGTKGVKWRIQSSLSSFSRLSAWSCSSFLSCPALKILAA